MKLENLEEYEKAIKGHIDTSGFLIPVKNQEKIYGQAKRILVSAHIERKSDHVKNQILNPYLPQKVS